MSCVFDELNLSLHSEDKHYSLYRTRKKKRVKVKMLKQIHVGYNVTGSLIISINGREKNPVLYIDWHQRSH